MTKIPTLPAKWEAFYDMNVFGVVLLWYGFQACLALAPLGPVVKGQPLKDGKRLDYRCNGLYNISFYILNRQGIYVELCALV